MFSRKDVFVDIVIVKNGCDRPHAVSVFHSADGRPVVQVPGYSDVFVTIPELLDMYEKKSALCDAYCDYLHEIKDRRCSTHYVPKKKKTVSSCMG